MKKLALLGLSVFLVACSHNTATQTTQSQTQTVTETTTKAPVIQEVVYDMKEAMAKTSDMSKELKIKLTAVDGTLTKASIVAGEPVPNYDQMSDEQKKSSEKIAKDYVNTDANYQKYKDLSGVEVSSEMVNNIFTVTMTVDFTVANTEQFQEKLDDTPLQHVFGETAKIYGNTMSLESAEAILTAQGGKKE